MTFDPNQPSQQPFQPPVSGQAPSGTPANIPSFIPASVALAPKKASQGRVATGTIVLVVAGFVAAAGIGFAGGRATAPVAATGNRNFTGANGQGFPTASGGVRNGGAFGALGAGSTAVDGTVTAVGSGTITVETAPGQSVTITVPSTTTYHGQTAAQASDVAVGSKVAVTINRTGFGRPDASGAPAGAAASPGTVTITATDVTLLAK